MIPAQRNISPSNLLPVLLSFTSLVFITIYTAAFFFEIPYIGFQIVTPNPRIRKFFIQPEVPGSLQIGDQIIKFGSNDWTYFSTENLASRSFPEVSTGEIVPITILRDGELLTIDWKIPGLNWAEVLYRLSDIWYLSYVFWLFAVMTLFLVRPRDVLWGLMAGFFLCVSMWLGAGFASYGGVWYSPISMRVVTWIMLAFALHFHWNFPKPFFRIPKLAIAVLYLMAVLLACLEITQTLPPSSYVYGVILAIFGSLVMLLIHLLFFSRHRQRSHLWLIGVAAFLLVGLQATMLVLSPKFILFPIRLTLLFTPLLPLVYFYSVYTSHFGGLEFRLNRLIGLMTFIVLVFAASGILLTAVYLTINSEIPIVLMIIIITAAAIFGAVFYPVYQEWFEYHFLGLPKIPSDLPGRFTTLLMDKLEIKNITTILETQIFPSLMIRQAVVIRLFTNQHQSFCSDYKLIARLGVPTEYIPPIEELSNTVSVKLSEPYAFIDSPDYPWINLVLPLRAGKDLIGVCLLGRRDPDDYYSSAEIPVLQAMLDQAALAILHVEQSTNLRAFHQADILRQEEQQKYLARILHDEVLGQMTVMALNAELIPANEQLQQSYSATVESIRNLISSLRPSALNFGLQVALEDCLDHIQSQMKQSDNHPNIILTSTGDNFIRYPSEVEIQVFRIVQQACYNAIQHAEAKVISITAAYDPEQIDIKIKDNGCGFAVPPLSDLSSLLKEHHFGLVGMKERAALIKADLYITSVLEKGTEVSISWQAEDFASL